MDDLDNDIKWTIDDAMDEAELLPNRYLNMLDQPYIGRIVHVVEAIERIANT